MEIYFSTALLKEFMLNNILIKLVYVFIKVVLKFFVYKIWERSFDGDLPSFHEIKEKFFFSIKILSLFFIYF